MKRAARGFVSGAAFLLLAGCAGRQSALDPAGPFAGDILQLGLGMTIAAIAVLLLVTVLMLPPLLRPREDPLAGATRRRAFMLWGGGVILPSVTLTALLPFVLAAGSGQRSLPAGTDAISVHVAGHQFWWEVRYDRGPFASIATANELVVPVGAPVRISLTASDVIHSFWVPSLAGKTDMIPGRTNAMTLVAGRPGVYRGQCAEFCGLQHALMAFDVVALERDEFRRWLERRAGAPTDPLTEEARRGRTLFTQLGCGGCHAIKGVSDGGLGPDLSFVAARRSIGAGALPNGVGNLAAWIASTQHLKPGARMPTYDQLAGPDLRALATYLAGLK